MKLILAPAVDNLTPASKEPDIEAVRAYARRGEEVGI
jgi:hypothetical protein